MRYFYFLFAFVISAVIGNYSAFACGGDDGNKGSGNYMDNSTIIASCGGDDDKD